MWLLWKETEIFTSPKASEEKGFYHVTTVWTLNLAKESTKGQDSKPSQDKSVSCVSFSVALGSFGALSVKDQGPWLKKMTDKQKCLPAFLSKMWHAKMRPKVRFAVTMLMLVIHSGISLGQGRSHLNHFIGLGLYSNFILCSLFNHRVRLQPTKLKRQKKFHSLVSEDFLFW